MMTRMSCGKWAFGVIACWTGYCAAYAPAAGMLTPWGEKVTPENAWREYPRPQMYAVNDRRASFLGEFDAAALAAVHAKVRKAGQKTGGQHFDLGLAPDIKN